MLRTLYLPMRPRQPLKLQILCLLSWNLFILWTFQSFFTMRSLLLLSQLTLLLLFLLLPNIPFKGNALGNQEGPAFGNLQPLSQKDTSFLSHHLVIMKFHLSFVSNCSFVNLLKKFHFSFSHLFRLTLLYSFGILLYFSQMYQQHNSLNKKFY